MSPEGMATFGRTVDKPNPQQHCLIAFNSLIFLVSLNREAHEKALEFAVNQSTPELGKRVDLNTLAVYAVHSFLGWMEIETDLNASDSWNPFLGSIVDTADMLERKFEEVAKRAPESRRQTRLLPKGSAEYLQWAQEEQKLAGLINYTR